MSCSARAASCSATSSSPAAPPSAKTTSSIPNAAIGGTPQDQKYKDDPTRLEIGDNNVFREGVTIHIGTTTGMRRHTASATTTC